MSTFARSWLVALTASLAVAASATPPALGGTSGPPAANGETLGFHRLQGVIATSPDHAFAVGNYGIYTRGRIKEWDGQTWSNARTSFGKDAELQSADAVSDSDAWAVGYYTDKRAGTGVHGLTAHWDGHRWHNVRGAEPSEQRYLRDVSMVSSDDAWAVGNTNNVPQEEDSQTLVKHWNGHRWSVVSSPNPSDSANWLRAVAAVSPDDVWAVGRTGEPTSQILMMHWNGTQWEVVDAPDAWIADLTAVSTDDVWAVGYRQVSGSWKPVVEHWDGAQWTVVPSPDPASPQGDFLTGVSAASTDDVWAVGYERDTLYYPSRTLIEHWDGHTWKLVDSPDPGAVQNGLTAVSADASDDAWAVGLFASQDDDTEQSKPLMLHWDGASWTRAAGTTP